MVLVLSLKVKRFRASDFCSRESRVGFLVSHTMRTSALMRMSIRDILPQGKSENKKNVTSKVLSVLLIYYHLVFQDPWRRYASFSLRSRAPTAGLE